MVSYPWADMGGFYVNLETGATAASEEQTRAGQPQPSYNAPATLIPEHYGRMGELIPTQTVQHAPNQGLTYQGVVTEALQRGDFSSLEQMANTGYLSQLPGFDQAHFDSTVGPAIANWQSAVSDSPFADLGMFTAVAAPLAAVAAPAIAGAAGGGMLGSAAAGGTIGAVGGGATAAIQEGNILEGALTGGAIGAAGGALSNYLGDAFSGAPAAVPQEQTSLADLTQLAQGGNVMTDVPLTGAPAPLMPPAVPEVDPTFGGALTQTGTGQFENLGNIESFGSTVPQALPSTPAAPPGSVDVLPPPPPAPVSSPSEIPFETTPIIPNPSEIGFEGLPEATAAAAGGTAAATAGDASGGGSSSSGVAPGSALSRILGMDPDLANLLGVGAATGLGFIGSREQTQALERLAAQYMELGAPSRARYEASFSPDFRPENIPGYTAALDSSMDALLRRLSTQGNPYGNPGGLMEAQKYVTGNVALPAIQNYRAQNANTGGYSSFNTAAPSTATSAIGSDANTYNVIGAGIADATRPRRPSLNDIYRSLV